MRRHVVSVALVLFVSALPVHLGAWGSDTHRELTGLAISLLPDGLRPFFESRRAFVVEHSVDPDLWRLAGFDEEAPRHFLDMDGYGAPPFPGLPHEYDMAVQRYGREFVQRNGQLPWRLTEIYGNLVRAFEDVRKGVSPYALENAAFYAAILAHYVGDAHVPLHAVVNYDGQLTGQHGVHSRFESELPRLFADERAVRQITLNLLSNAIKFTPTGGEVRVRVGWTVGGGQYVSVKDNGPGIPPDEIPVVLSAFGQGSIAIKSAEQGTGLGLPIVQGLVAMHGGAFDLQSKLREGTEAIAVFPPTRVMEELPAVPMKVATAGGRRR